MFLHQRFVPGLAIASYLVGDEKSGQGAVIDPTRDVEPYLEMARARNLRIEHVLETHVHADYVSGSRELQQRLGRQVTVHCSGMGGKQWTPPYADRVVKDGDELTLGSLRLRAVHTPGHTPEHLIWTLYDQTRSAEQPWLAFTGDLLFVGDVGRPDLLGEQQQRELAGQLHHSLFERLRDLPDFVEIFPGHGAGSLCGKAIGSRRSSTIGYERRFNVSMQFAPQPQWAQRLLADMPPAPPYFLRMKKINAEGPELLEGKLPGLSAISPKTVRERLGELLVLDVRSKEAFAAAHVPGAINIGLADNLPTWAGWVLPYDQPIVLVLDDPGQARTVAMHLVRVGFDRIDGYVAGGIEGWQEAGLPIETVGVLSVHALRERLTSSRNGELAVLDVRSDSEFSGGHIAGARHVHAGLLQQHVGELPRERPIAVLCGSGYRAGVAASVLRHLGFMDVYNVMGGMTAWKSAGFPTES